MSSATNQHAMGSGGGQRHASGSNSVPPVSQPNTPSTQNQSQTLLPQYFIVRPGMTKHTATGTVTVPGPIVPLVAVDQLPEWIDLLGVPRELGLEQTVGLTNLGTVIRDPEFYQVYMHSGDIAATPPAEEAPVASGSNTMAGAAHESQRRQLEQAQQHRHAIVGDGNGNLMIVPVDTSVTSSPPSGSSSVETRTLPSTSESTSSTGMDPAVKTTSNNSLDKKLTGGNGTAKANRAKADSHGTQHSSTVGSYLPRLPSPTVAGSTPPPRHNPQSHTHPFMLYPQLHPHPHPHLQAYAAPPPPPHPADRLLHTYTPLAPSRHAKQLASTSTSTRKTGSGGAANNNNNSSGSNSNNPSSIYCRHWCHRGTCRWGTHCRYTHAMPASAEGLREVGLPHYPGWWTAAVSMANSLAMGQPGGAGGGGGGYGGGAMPWYPAPAPPSSYRYYGSGWGKKAQKEREKDKDKGGEKEKERERERGSGKGRAVEKDGKDGSPKTTRSETDLLKKGAVEGNAGAAGDQGKGKQPEQPQPNQKLVEI
ncbi:hypothetical protein F4677DRAFT_89162 [Hypoxylon crocopeplum]|nr:hypothetical protein F4677DRAFT_89162 [Hypoxylon crocopeplum]